MAEGGLRAVRLFVCTSEIEPANVVREAGFLRELN